jgi:DNA topoisomerase-1
MQVAQRLYEGTDIGGETVGLITYMRTDGVDVAPEAVSAIRGLIGKDFGRATCRTRRANTPPSRRTRRRPTRPSGPPTCAAIRARSRSFLEPEQARLYELIWKRTVASQMESAELERTTVDIDATVGGLGSSMGRKLELRATGQVVKFDGFLTLYTEDRDDDERGRGRQAPAGHDGRREARPQGHRRHPALHRAAAALFRGEPRQAHGRARHRPALHLCLDPADPAGPRICPIDKKRLVPEDKGRLVIAFLENFFERYVEYGFTAALEERLDLVSNSELDWKALLRDFWRDFAAAIDETKELRVSDVLSALNDSLGPHIFPDKGDGSNPRACPTCGNGTLSLKLGKFGAFIGCSNYPECRFTRQLAAPAGLGGRRARLGRCRRHPQAR